MEGKEGARRLVLHIESPAHVAAKEAKIQQDSFHRQSDKHPWLKVLKKYCSQEVEKLIRLAMDAYNDTMCETVSGFSWPSRNLTNARSSQLVSQFSCDWDSKISSFEPTGFDMHYTSTDTYYDMISCIAEIFKSEVLNELQESDGFGVQIDGSTDRQQLGVKFVMARIVKDGKISTRFLGAVEPEQKGASGLLEALGQALQKPGQASCTIIENDVDADTSDISVNWNGIGTEIILNQLTGT